MHAYVVIATFFGE